MYKQAGKMGDYHIGGSCWFVQVKSDMMYDFCLWKVRIVKPHMEWKNNFECIIREVLVGDTKDLAFHQTVDYTWLSKTLDEALDELTTYVRKDLIIKSIFRRK